MIWSSGLFYFPMSKKKTSSNGKRCIACDVTLCGPFAVTKVYFHWAARKWTDMLVDNESNNIAAFNSILNVQHY